MPICSNRCRVLISVPAGMPAAPLVDDQLDLVLAVELAERRPTGRLISASIRLALWSCSYHWSSAELRGRGRWCRSSSAGAQPWIGARAPSAHLAKNRRVQSRSLLFGPGGDQVEAARRSSGTHSVNRRYSRQ